MSESDSTPIGGGDLPLPKNDIWKELGFDKMKLGEIKAPSKPKPVEEPKPKPPKK